MMGRHGGNPLEGGDIVVVSPEEREHRELSARLSEIAERFEVEIKEIPDTNIIACCLATKPGKPEYIRNHLDRMRHLLNVSEGDAQKRTEFIQSLELWEVADGQTSVEDASDADNWVWERVICTYQDAQNYLVSGIERTVAEKIIGVIKELIPDIDSKLN